MSSWRDYLWKPSTKKNDILMARYNIVYGYSCKCYSCPSLTVDILLDMTSRTDAALYLENSLLAHVGNRSSCGVHDGYLVSLFRPMSSSSAQDNSPAPPMSA